MTTSKIIDGLYFTVGMMLFNPATGEAKTPDELNEDDRYTYDACMGAIEALKAQEPVEPKKNYVELAGLRTWDWACPECNCILTYRANYCSCCGRAVKWDG